LEALEEVIEHNSNPEKEWTMEINAFSFYTPYEL